MSRRVSDDRLEVIQMQIADAIKRHRKSVWMSMDGHDIVEAHDIACLLDELKKRRFASQTDGKFKLGSCAKLLITMKVGESVIIPPSMAKKMSFSRRNARKHLGIQDAVWLMVRLPQSGQYKVTRMPDGSNPYQKESASEVQILASMRVGEFRLVPFKVESTAKTRARHKLGDHFAQWTYKKLAEDKFRVQRVA